MNGSDAFLWLALCGLAAVIIGLLALGVFTILRRLSVRDAVGLFTFMQNQDDGLEDRPVIQRRRSTDLRAKVDEVSFDDALAKYQGQSVPPTPFDSGLEPNLPPSRFDNLSSGRSERRRRKSEEYGYDEVFGGMLDRDGDGDPDY